jgi:hypothetical protein
MQGSDDKEERSDRGIEPSSSGGRKSQSFVYPIRSLLGPLQQSGSEDILETLLSRECTRIYGQPTSSSQATQRPFCPPRRDYLSQVMDPTFLMSQ